MGAFHDFEHRGWQQAAAHYAGSFGELTALAAEPLLDAARVGQGTRVLDVATGPGYVAAAAARRGAVVAAIDFAPEMVALARRLHPALANAVREGDAAALADAPASHDAVVMSFGLLHLERPEAAIAEAHRVLAPGGRYAFTVWAPPARARGFGIVLEALAAHGQLDVGLPEGPPFFRFGDPDESRRALAAFHAIEITTLPLVWRLRSPDELFEAALRGGVRTSAVMQAQTPAALAAVRSAIAAGCAAHRTEHGFAIPMHVVLACAVK